MTYSPMEGADRSLLVGIAVVTSGGNPLYVLVGSMTGPVFAWLGYRWRVERWWASAVAVVAALCLEPLARRTMGEVLAPTAVWVSEIVVGVAVAVLFARTHRTVRPVSSSERTST